MLSGFGNHHQSEALSGALPTKQNSPQTCPYGLYAEQLSGTAFTAPRFNNLFSWLYRMQPSVVQEDFVIYCKTIQDKFIEALPPNPLRWSAFPHIENSLDFIDGLFHFAGNPLLNTYLYQCNRSMELRYFSNHDGELLFVPYQGTLHLHTEFGLLTLAPGEIAVIPRGIKFKVEIKNNYAAGYLCENKAKPLTLPSLGAIGANGLANPRHFLYPQAAFEDFEADIEIICKFQEQWWQALSHHSPLNVIAWHGNYAPYKYDLSLFNTINTVGFDHPDPSIFTVLTSESNTSGVANLDFVIFPPRWMVAEDTFRPPYFHRNIMSELMGLVKGTYDAKSEQFEIGGISIHNCMTAHGPDAETFKRASTQELQPEFYKNTLAFMFESRKPWQVTLKAWSHAARQTNYAHCWKSLKRALLNNV